MTYVGITPEGEQLMLPDPVSITIDSDEDAPADSFSGVFPLDTAEYSLTAVKAFEKDGSLFFDGIVDRQTWECSTSGTTQKLTARSRAALLLDNEALPQTYYMPSLRTVFDRHVRPYGFSGYLGRDTACNGQLEVSKGMSEWEVVETFCRKFLLRRPRIQNGVLDVSEEPEQEVLVISNRGGYKYTNCIISNYYYKLYTEIWAKTDSGYRLQEADTEAEDMGIQRRRYVNPASLQQTTEELLRSAKRKAFEITVTIPGECPAKPGRPVRLEHEKFGVQEGYSVAQNTYTRGNSGEFCRLTLRRDC